LIKRFTRSKLHIYLLCLFMILTLLPQTTYAKEKLIEDPNLEHAIRMELQKFSGDLTREDLLQLNSLYPKDTEQKVGSLSGLENATNIGSLFLPNLGITNIDPIASLTKITFLGLNNNTISNIEPLRKLTKLQRLVINDNQIENMDSLSALKLTDLLIGNNHITDISPLRDLPLKWLIISHNQISDIEPLKNISSLEHVYIDNNQISDISVLEELPNLQEVDLENNPLNEKFRSGYPTVKTKRGHYFR
jgi:hypothetical protein